MKFIQFNPLVTFIQFNPLVTFIQFNPSVTFIQFNPSVTFIQFNPSVTFIQFNPLVNLTHVYMSYLCTCTWSVMVLISQFCSSHSLQEVYIELFGMLILQPLSIMLWLLLFRPNWWESEECSTEWGWHDG